MQLKTKASPRTSFNAEGRKVSSESNLQWWKENGCPREAAKEVNRLPVSCTVAIDLLPVPVRDNAVIRRCGPLLLEASDWINEAH